MRTTVRALWIVTLAGCADPTTPRSLVGAYENGHALHDLAGSPLTSDSLTNVDALQEALRDPSTQYLLSYIVSCALPEGTSIDVVVDGQSLHYDGQGTGLAPEWAVGPCEDACQEWVSACVMARTNAFGVPVLLDLRGAHESISDIPLDEQQDFPVEEGAFWGNLFEEPAQQFTCRGRGYDEWYLSFRICTLEGSPCLFDWVGTCDLVDGTTGRPTERKACEELDPTAGGIYRRCHDVESDVGGETFPAGSRVWDRVITTYVKDATFE